MWALLDVSAAACWSRPAVAWPGVCRPGHRPPATGGGAW